LWGAIGFSILLQMVVFMTPLGEPLHVVPLVWRDALVAILGPVFATLIAVDIHKFIWHLMHKRH
jgi:hypothetical protein